LLAVNVTLLVPALSAPVMLILPVALLLLMVTLLVVAALSVMPVRLKLLTLSVKFTLPLVVFVALKLVTVFVLVSVVPLAEVVVRVTALMMPAPDSAIELPVIVTLPVVLIPLTGPPRSSVKLATVSALFALMRIGPEILFAATLEKTFPAPELVERSTLFELRSNKPAFAVDRLMIPVCEMLWVVSNVSTPLEANVALAVHVPTIIVPVLLSPIRTSVACIVFNIFADNTNPLEPVAILIFVPLVPSRRMANCALSVPVPVPSPPTCEPVVLRLMVLAINVTVPVVNSLELFPVVMLLLPAFSVSAPAPVLTVVLAACVMPFAPINESAELLGSTKLLFSAMLPVLAVNVAAFITLHWDSKT